MGKIIKDYIEGKKYEINNNYYFVIYDKDIRIFNNDGLRLFDINTYPYEPILILSHFIILQN
jgi:hypothetical protein